MLLLLEVLDKSSAGELGGKARLGVEGRMESLFLDGERHGGVCFGVEKVAARWTWAKAGERRGLGCPESP